LETNIAKNIDPITKGLIGFILFGGAIYLFVGGGGLKTPEAHAWLRPCEYEAILLAAFHRIIHLAFMLAFVHYIYSMN